MNLKEGSEMVNPLHLYTEKYDLAAEGNWLMSEKQNWGRKFKVVDPDEYLRMRRAEAQRMEAHERQFSLLAWFAIGSIVAVLGCFALWVL
jgi:hypothetical protein